MHVGARSIDLELPMIYKDMKQQTPAESHVLIEAPKLDNLEAAWSCIDADINIALHQNPTS